MSDDDRKVVVGVSPEPNGVAQVILLIPPPAWDYTEGGNAHTFDLTKWGYPIQIILGRCKDRADGIATITKANADRGLRTVDGPEDIALKPKDAQ